jgi:hypothetical protein
MHGMAAQIDLEARSVSVQEQERGDLGESGEGDMVAIVCYGLNLLSWSSESLATSSMRRSRVCGVLPLSPVRRLPSLVACASLRSLVGMRELRLEDFRVGGAGQFR